MILKFSHTLIDPEVGGSSELVRLEGVHSWHDGDAGDLALRPVRLLRRELERAASRVAVASDGVAAAPLSSLIDLVKFSLPQVNIIWSFVSCRLSG